MCIRDRGDSGYLPLLETEDGGEVVITPAVEKQNNNN